MDEIFILNRLNLENGQWEFLTSSDNLSHLVFMMLQNQDNVYQIMVNDFNNRSKPVYFEEWYRENRNDFI